MNDDNQSKWREAGSAYRDLIEDVRYDSRYLRHAGLIPTINKLLGPVDGLTVLDAGSGPGWLLDELGQAEVHACDIDPNAGANRHPNFSVQDIRQLSYADETYDIVVANFVLMWISELDQACEELYRVTKPEGGRLIVSLVHPYFYRTGTTREDGAYLITRQLHCSGPVSDHKIAGRVGPFQYFYHRMDTYLNSLIGAGWRVCGVHDWFVDMDDYRKHNVTTKTEVKRTGHVPLYTFIDCLKP